MLLSACFVFTLSVIYLVFNHNKMEYAMLLYMISISFLMTISAIYIYKLTSYSFSSFGDFELYRLINKLDLSLSDVARLQNISMAMLMCSSLLILLFFAHFKKLFFLLILPILFFLVVNDPSFTWNMYLLSYIPQQHDWISFLVSINRQASLGIFFIYSALPMATLMIAAFRTQIRVRRTDCLIYLLSLLLMNFFIFVTFFAGTFKAVMFHHVDLMKFPLTPLNAPTKHTFSPYIIIFIVLFISLLTIFFKPFKEWRFVTRKELFYNSQQIKQNLRMTLHTYKNSFLGVQKLTDLMRQYVEAGETQKMLSCMEMMDKISSENLKNISHAILLMKNVKLKYNTVSIVECIESAIQNSCLPDDIHIDRQYQPGELEYLKTLGDMGHLQEALVNLLTNAAQALKYKKNVVPTITIRIIPEEDICSVEILDNGCGIEKKQLRNIFKAYYSTKTANNSFGIGLSYVETVIRQHRGSITVKSVKNEYTSFQIVLPRIKAKRKKIELMSAKDATKDVADREVSFWNKDSSKY